MKVTAKQAIDYSISNINRLINIDTHRLSISSIKYTWRVLHAETNKYITKKGEIFQDKTQSGVWQ